MDYLKKAPPNRTGTPDSIHGQKSRKQEAKFNREVVIGELIETEDEFARDIQKVVDKYLNPLEEETRPASRCVMDNKEIIFNNLRQIATFHKGIMVEGVKYFLKEPKTIGKTLLRLERDFDKHAQYCRNEPAAQELLEINEEVRDYFEDLSQEIGDDKILTDHLKLPIQRINDYQLLLKELIKYSKILCEDTTDLERALELMLWIPSRCNDLKFVTNIEGFHGNIHKLGRLIRHNWFLVKDKTGGKGRERYCFLFKARLLICKVRRISEDRCVFVLKEIIKLPEVDFKNYPDKKSFQITHKDPDYGNYPFTFTAHEDTVKSDWLNEIAEHVTEPLALAEHAADDLKVQKEPDDDLFEPLKGIELDISPDIEEGLDPIERAGRRPLKHVPEPKRPPLEIPKKRVPIFTCVDPEPEPEPEPKSEMFSTLQIEEHFSITSSTQEEMYTETQSSYQEVTATESITIVEEPEVEELIEIAGGKRKPKYIPGVSRPLFHSNIRGTTNEPGENAVFECEVEGVTSMTWLKDNRPMSDKLADRINIVEDKESNTYRLELKNVSESDSGTYTARAENAQGVSFSTALLIVEKLTDEEKKARAKTTTPVFTVQLKDAELLEGTHARFMVKVNGNPVPTVQFYKGDKLITEEDENILINKEKADKGFYELVIPDVKPEDAGEYRCVASNKYSDESCSCIVTVTNEKDVFAGLQDEIGEGGAPQFLWLKNGKPFYPEERFKVIFKDEEDSLALVFQNVKADDAGLYTCIASTSHGKISCSAELTVQGTVKELQKLPKLAKITTITKQYDVNAGSNAVLEVTASGDPLPNIKWKRNGKEIENSGRYKLIYDEETETASLVIKNVNLDDSGEYVVIAENEISMDKQTLSLSIKAAPVIKRHLEDFVGLTGKPLRFTIEVEASPKPIVQWYKDGMVLKQSKRIKYVTDEASDSYTLVIEDAVMDDAGTYSVVASNQFSQVSDVCHLTMRSPPQFVGSLTKEIETLEGDYVSFSVMVEGDPLPKPKWIFNGNVLEHDGIHVKISEDGPVYTLLLSEVKRTDAGTYTCEISNQFGSNESDGLLIVKCVPQFTAELEDTKVKEGDTDVRFTVKMNSYPKSTVTWYRDDADITTSRKDYVVSEDGDSYTLTIKKATTKIAGIYKCRAVNEIGTGETSASFTVLTLPNFRKELDSVDIKEGETLKLTVQCRGVPEPEVKWYKDGEEIYSDSRIKITRDAKRIENYNLTITLVQSEDGGEYEVRATNEMGTAVTKSQITVLANTSHKKRTNDEPKSSQETDVVQNKDKETADNVDEEAAVNDQDENIITKSTMTTTETTNYGQLNGDPYSETVTTKNVTHTLETIVAEDSAAVNNAIFVVNSSIDKKKDIDDDNWADKSALDSNANNVLISTLNDINGKKDNSKQNYSELPVKNPLKSKWGVTESEIIITTMQTNDNEPEVVETRRSNKSYSWNTEDNVVTFENSTDDQRNDSKLFENEIKPDKKPAKVKWAICDNEISSPSKDESATHTIQGNTTKQHTFAQNVTDDLTVKLPGRSKETYREENVSSTICDDDDISDKEEEEEEEEKANDKEKRNSEQRDGFSVCELNGVEFDAATDLKPSSFGIIEEPPENEYYIKINVSRGVSIVSVSEEENFPAAEDDRVVREKHHPEEVVSSSAYCCRKKNVKPFGKDEQSEELTLEIEQDRAGKDDVIRRKRIISNDITTSSRREDKVVMEEAEDDDADENERKSSKAEKVEINKANEEEIVVIRKKSSSRLAEIEETEDDTVNELLKRIQQQRNILGEILERKENSEQQRRTSVTDNSSSSSSSSRRYSSRIGGSIDDADIAGKVIRDDLKENDDNLAKSIESVEDKLESVYSKYCGSSGAGRRYSSRVSVVDDVDTTGGLDKPMATASHPLKESNIEKDIAVVESTKSTTINENGSEEKSDGFETAYERCLRRYSSRLGSLADKEDNIVSKNNKVNIGKLESTTDHSNSGVRKLSDAIGKDVSEKKTNTKEVDDDDVKERDRKHSSGLKSGDEERPLTTSTESDNRRHSSSLRSSEEELLPLKKSPDSEDKGHRELSEEKKNRPELDSIVEKRTSSNEAKSIPNRRKSKSVVQSSLEEQEQPVVQFHLTNGGDSSKSKSEDESDFEQDQNAVKKPKPELSSPSSVNLLEEHDAAEDKTKSSERTDKTSDVINGDEDLLSNRHQSSYKSIAPLTVDRPPAIANGNNNDDLTIDENIDHVSSKSVAAIDETPKTRKMTSDTVDSKHDIDKSKQRNRSITNERDRRKRSSVEGEKKSSAAATEDSNELPDDHRICPEIKEYPKIVSGLDEDLNTYETLSVTCEVVGSGVPTPTATWYKDGDELIQCKKVHMAQDGNRYKLELMDLKSADAGTYTVKLENSIGDISKSTQLNISNVENLRGPKIKSGLKDTVITKGQKVIMSATYIADPVPDATWTVNDKPVNADFSVDVKEIELDLKECQYTMAIPTAELTDTGTYKLKVRNKFETAECGASLTIVMQPEIEAFEDIIVTPSTSCKYETVVTAVPEAIVTWLINGKPIDTKNINYKLESDRIDDYNVRYTLEIADTQLSDQGDYTLTAKNELGSSSSSANLKLYVEAPFFVKLLEDRAVQDNDLLQMKIRVNGIPNPSVAWFKNGVPIISNDHIKVETSEEGQVSSTLIIDCFTDRDVAEYKIVATNVAGESETAAKLTMAQIEPSFNEPLKRIVDVFEGSPLELVSKVGGSPIPSVQWFKDGEELKPDGEHIKSTVDGDGTIKLFIDNVEAPDCGAYKVVATNAIGKCIGNTAVVVNQSPRPAAFIKELKDVTVTEGNPIKFDIQVAGFPEPKIKWLKDGHPLHACPAVDFTSAPNGIYGLTIDRTKLEDAGVYSIIVSNKFGEVSSVSKAIVMPAEKEPFFQSKLQPTKVVDGYPAKLEVNVGGFPVPETSWYFNDQPLKIDGDNIKLVTGTDDGSSCLLIEKVSPANAGTYKVVAKNDLGENATKAELSVASRTNSEAANEKTVFLHGLRDTTVDESSVLSISAPFLGNPIPDVEWYKDGCFLQPNERIHFTCDGYKVGLEIQDTNMGDSGFYSCVLKNPYGEDSSAAHIGIRKLYQAPIFTQRFTHMQQLPGKDSKFHARVTGVPFPSVIWHRNGQPIANSDKYQIKRDGDICCLTVFNVSPDDDALYSCIASNRDGTATCEAQLEVVEKIETTPKQEPPVFMKRIGDCDLFPGMTAKFTACATGYPEPEYEWFLDTIRLHPSDRYIMEKESSGLVRLKILEASPDTDTGRYKLRAFNPHGEAYCEAQISFDTGLDSRPKRPPVGELYKDYDRYRATGAPLPLPDKPIISRMTDRHLTLSWKPSMPIASREPVTYLVEMEEQPDGEWSTARAGIRSCACDIHNLIPFRDYKFRVRVENTYGISEPSPYAVTYREKLQPDPPKIRTHLPHGSTFHPDTSAYFPKDFDIERPPHDNYAQAPRFLRQEYETQHGVKGHNVNLFWFIYGYPKPKMSFYFNDQLIEMGGRYDSSYTRNGQATLFINKMLDRDVGVYEAVATNEHGIARQRVQLKIAEYPEFLRRPEETTVQIRKSCRLEARVIGVPYPEVKWYKDWQPLTASSRIQIDQIEPDLCILRITDVIMKDAGLYSISARNIAGSISTSVALHVEEEGSTYADSSRRSSWVKTRTKPFDELYDLGDELGRGTQGIVHHVVERSTGKTFAAKIMHGTGDLRKLMNNELDIMNQLHHRHIIRPHDTLVTPSSFTLIEELGGGGELLDNLTRKSYITEYEISTYIRQLLLALDSMHEFNIAHLGLTPGDLLISHAGGDELKLTDFGLSRKINSRKLEPLYFGMPEYVPPEAANGEGVNLSADMWSVGVITHLLLTGISLFRGKDDAETLDKIKAGKFSVSMDISEHARDFIVELLMLNPNNRMDVKTALNHRWIQSSDTLRLSTEMDRKINTETLKNHYNLYKNWYSNSSCRTWYRRRPLESAYQDPSRMIYPPGLAYTPAPTPERSALNDEHHVASWRDKLPPRPPVDVNIGVAKSESHYQYGPDTYLLQLRDVDFPVRLREYMKVANVSHENIDYRAPIIRERRKFMDVMDEEIDDERKARINQYDGNADIYTLRRLKQEVGSRPIAHVEAEAILGSRIDGQAPFFREKPQIMSVEIDKPADLVCYAVGTPKPVVQWFKNDLVVTEGPRVIFLQDKDGRSILRLNPVSDFDLGIYKVVARNKFGQTTARTRLLMASEPSAPLAPKISKYSDSEVLLKWDRPKDDGNCSILCYCLQMKEDAYGEWTTVADNIDHEYWLVHDLRPNVKFQFRLSAMNRIGWSPEGFPSEFVKTKLPGVMKIDVSDSMRQKQAASEKGREIIGEEPRNYIDYSREYKPIQWSDEPTEEKYKYISEIYRGQFSIVAKALDTEKGSLVAAKLLETKGDLLKKVNHEFDILRVVCHERIAYLMEAFRCEYTPVAVFIMEKLQGADILTYLTSGPSYTEQTVAILMNQVLDGLQYLHWRDFCHLNLQPSNIVMSSVRNLQVKLIDFGCARHINKLGTVVHSDGPLEYTAPEILCEEPAYPNSDIWSVGVLTYILLSSVSPFRGTSDVETRQNITFVRYRFEHLYKNLSQEATRFMMLLFKRSPSKRPSAEECQEHRWLLPSEYMIKKREKTSFNSNKLKAFSDDYHSKINNSNTVVSKEIMSVAGSNLNRSNSILEELGVSI